jgi:excisionase family DNA binding protein
LHLLRTLQQKGTMTSSIAANSQEEQRLAAQSVATLEQLALHSKSTGQQVVDIALMEAPDIPIAIPAKVFDALQKMLHLMADGQSFALLSDDTELTTVQAAEILRVSRPHLIKLLEEGQIAFRKVGRHRRVLLGDLLLFQSRQKTLRENALDALVQQAQELNMGY